MLETLKDMMPGWPKVGVTAIENLLFQEFQRLMTLDLDYNPQKDEIFYEPDDTSSVEISNQRDWIASMKEMHALGCETFSFYVQYYSWGTGVRTKP